MKLPKSKLTLLLLLCMVLSACGESACGGAFTGPLAVIVQSIFPQFADNPIVPASQTDLAPFLIWIAEAASATPLSLIRYENGTASVGGVNVLSGIHAGGMTNFYKDPTMQSQGLYLWHDSSIEFLHGGTGAVVATIPVGPRVLDFSIANDGKFGYATGAGSTQIYAVDLAASARKVAYTVDLGSGASPFASAIMPDMSRVYVADALNGRYYSVNPAAKTFTTTSLQLPQTEMGKPAVTPDGGQLWIPLVTLDEIAVYDTFTDTQVAIVKGFTDPREIVFSPNGATAYVLNSPPSAPGSVSAFDAKTRTFKWATRVGSRPSGLSLSPASSLLLVANSGDGTVTVVKPNGDTASTPVGRTPVAVTTNR